MSTLVVVLVCLSIWRLARLVAVDEITRPLRERVINRFGVDGQIAYLVTCLWCVSPYIGAVVSTVAVLVVGATDPWLWVALLTATGSLVSGIGQSIEDRLDR